MFILYLLLLAGMPSGTAPGVSSGDWQIEHYRWSGSIAEGRAIDIRNNHGDIRCRFSDSEEVLVSAVIQRHSDDPRRAEMAIEESKDGLTIAVLYPPVDDPGASEVTPEMEKRRVDLTALIPAGSRLTAGTIKGLIEAKGLESDVEASSLSGNIVLATTGLVHARTEHGRIDAVLESDTWQGRPTLETVTGDITLFLPPSTDATIRAETRGLITTDYSIEISQEAAIGPKQAVARIGEGHLELAITSSKGNIRILKSGF
ncbi:MAG: hypothetical protein WBH75_19905 [Thermoanaerobaculia bacterium]